MDELQDLIEMRRAVRLGFARARRVEAGLSQEDLARPIGVTAAAISRWERGQRIPRGEAALRYAAVLKKLVQ